MMESTCPFCDQQLVEVDEVVELCCDEQELENIDGMNTCVNCGKIYGYDYAAEYFDFYDNMHKIRKESVYHRNYHIDNVMNIISFKNNIQFSHETNKIRFIKYSLRLIVFYMRLMMAANG